MKFFKKRDSGPLDYRSSFKKAEAYLKTVESAVGRYLKNPGKEEGSVVQIRLNYQMARLDIDLLQTLAKTPEEKAGYQRLNSRLAAVSVNVARALENGAMGYVVSARRSIDTGDSLRISDEHIGQMNEEMSRRSEAVFEKNMSSTPEGRAKLARWQKEREQRKKETEELYARLGGRRYSNTGYTNAETFLNMADQTLGDAAEAAKISNSDRLPGEIDAAKEDVARVRKELEDRQK